MVQQDTTGQVTTGQVTTGQVTTGQVTTGQVTTGQVTTGQVTHHAVFAVQMKNWDPLVLAPALAMDRIPGPVCFRVKFSSANLFP